MTSTKAKVIESEIAFDLHLCKDLSFFVDKLVTRPLVPSS